MGSPVKRAKQKAQEKWPGAEVVERGKGHIVHKHPTEERYIWDSQVGSVGWHYGDGPYTSDHEVDTTLVPCTAASDQPWLYCVKQADYNVFVGPGTMEFDAGQIIKYVDPDTGIDITLQPMQLQWTNDLDQIEAIADPSSVSGTIDKSIITWEQAYGDMDFSWQTQTARLFKKLTINAASDIGSPAQYIIDGGNPKLRLQIIFETDADIWVDGVLWDRGQNNPQTPSKYVEFQSTNGEMLWYFRQPLAWGSYDSSADVETEIISPEMTIRRQGGNLFADILTPWSWLESAVFPVIIDDTVDYSVSASADDSAEIQSTNAYIVGSLNVDATGEWAGLRWQGVTIPADATINSDTYVDIVIYSVALDEPNHDIYFEDGANPGAFTEDLNNISGRTKTTASTHYGDGNELPLSANYDLLSSTPHGPINAQAMVAELQGDYDYSGGAAMVCFFEGTAVTQDDFGVTFYDNASSDAALLHIDYTAGAAEEDFTVPIMMYHQVYSRN